MFPVLEERNTSPHLLIPLCGFGVAGSADWLAGGGQRQNPQAGAGPAPEITGRASKRGDREGTSLGDMGRELLWVLQHQTEEWRFLRVWGRSWLFRLP